MSDWTSMGTWGLIWRNNTVEQTTAYPARTETLKPFEINFCDNVQIEK